MHSSLSEALNTLRLNSISEFEKGRYFEELIKIYLENDDAERQLFNQVWHYGDWAKENGKESGDYGIDLVARFSDGSGLCAIQCKFYQPDHRIQKPDIDSFISASATSDFQSLLLVDTTNKDLGANAKRVLENLEKEHRRIALTDLEKSRIDWPSYIRDGVVNLAEKKSLRQHQKEALEAVRSGLATDDRGKLIMACGTGKTFTGLKIAEELGGSGKVVLFMVPSLALMSQTVREWKNDCGEEFLAFSVCSDVKVGKRQAADDALQLTVHDLAFPATTNAEKIAEQVNQCDRSKMVVVFSTYQSIQAISDAQQKYDLPDFDLIICDEAHRTTGATIAGDDESNFVRIHSDEHVVAKKRLYMTATPKIYGENAKSKAKTHAATLASMDDEETFGKTLFYRGFSWAVENNLLSDYKVIVLAVDEGVVSSSVQSRLSDADEMKLDDATKIIGCYKALTKQNLIGEMSDSPKPMKRALAFCKNIAISKMVTNEFADVVEEYDLNDPFKSRDGLLLNVETDHVDGTFNAKERDDRLNWLKAETDDNTCRILTNARCLSEGVDVPALDAIMFLHPRNSQIDVVQSVGRVMRKAEGKEMGYVILPVAIPAGVAPEEALNDNERYRVVWQILNALRAHDERFDATINQASLGEDISGKIEIVGVPHPELDSITAVVDDIDINKTKAKSRTDIGGSDGAGDDVVTGPKPSQMDFVFDELTQAIRAKIVEKCGTREYWDTWASDIAKIAETHITRITSIIKKEGEERKAFQAFLDEIRDDLNPEISEADAVEMLAQHLITKPVFDTLFKDNEFTKNNPVSRAMEIVLEQLNHHNIGKEADSLQKFYESVQRRADVIKTAQGRQTLVVELYDKFFRTAFPAMTQKLGIVYTPVEVVDFIIHSVNDVLQSEFGQTLGSKGVHILDPFTGTGTFITRLLQSGLIAPEELEHKYRYEIHANEIVLLAYYIAAINIEAVYHDMAKENAIAMGESGEDMPYAPFDGIVLTDTFQLYEQDKDMIADLLPDNSERRTAQKERDVTVVFANPPYSAGQKSANDNAKNVSYPNLDQSIQDTFAKASTAKNVQNLYDSYIRAIKWGLDRIGDSGIVAYVTGNAWLERSFADGLRKTVFDECSEVIVLNLRGDVRKDMLSGGLAGEGGNIFGSGSMTGISIALFVKASGEQGCKEIKYWGMPDGMSHAEKIGFLRANASIDAIKFDEVIPDSKNDWLDQRDESFSRHIGISEKAGGVFPSKSYGLTTNRDVWCYNASSLCLSENVNKTLDFFNQETRRLASQVATSDTKIDVAKFLAVDPKMVSWSRGLRQNAQRNREIEFAEDKIRISHRRPFTQQWAYFDASLNEYVYKLPHYFPRPDTSNLVLMVSGTGARSGFSTLLANAIPDIQFLDNGQCFPLKLFEPASADDGLFATGETGYTERDGISDAGLKHFQDAYVGEQISKEDLFYYIYGLLHSPDYRERFKNNLSKELPRIPAVKKAEDFWAFSKAGRELGDLHVNYETVEPYPVVIAEGDLALANIDDPKVFYRVEKMKPGGKGKNKDKSIVHYNPRITMTGIPLEAYDYVVNGKPALDWVMERQCVKTDKASGIVNDANDYANETVGNPAYPLELFQRVITVSLETMKIVNGLPALDID